MDDTEVAIVGIACRFPGADDIDEYWKLLVNGECHVTKVPDDRWIIDEIDVKDVDDSWKSCTRNAGLVDEFDRWDNKFFGISDTEAAWMDPQQCMAIEVTHSALENGGFTRQKIKGTKTGVYIGLMNGDFSTGLTRVRHEFNNFIVSGIASGITANRISYFYDLRGPSIMVDTACSSALVAVHIGCQAIRSGDCEMAVCGGVNGILTPLKFIGLSKAKMVSPTGQCHAFSDKADGYARGEGCGILILKDLKKARRDGDNIWGTIGTGCNQDGQANTPMTAPSSEQQIVLLNDVYTQCKVDPGDIQYIEAHGTGTPVGDPIEIKALSTFFGQHHKPNSILPFGSVKTNIGHLESAAGVAGVIKVLLMMSHGKIVPSLHYKEGFGNPRINFKDMSLVVATTVDDWKPSSKAKRVACVNSFGFGGTNSHAILKQDQQNRRHKQNAKYPVPVIVTATSIPALQKTCQNMKQKLLTKDYNIEDLSYTSLLRRDHFRYRVAYVAASTEELIEEMNRNRDRIENLQASDKQDNNLIFLFCGVGTVWNGTCKEMYKTSHLFREKFYQIEKEIKKHDSNISLTEAIKNEDSSIVNDAFKGPLIIFACQVSLYYVWSRLGVCPDIIIGQSVGEIAAAHAAGCTTLQDAVKIIYHRSLLTSQTQKGRMMVIGKCDVEDIKQLCQQNENGLCVAVYSSREACVVSGNEKSIINLKDTLRKQQPDVLLKILDVSCAYHSSYMDDVIISLLPKIKDLKGNVPTTKIISSVTGKNVTDEIMGTADYWCKNLRKPVLLRDAVAYAMHEEKQNVVLEIGPKPVIRAHLKNITNKRVVSISSLNQPSERRTIAVAIAELLQMGYSMDLNEFIFDGTEELTDIPQYKFNRSGILVKPDGIKDCLKVRQEYSEGHLFVAKKLSSSDFKIDLFPTTTPFVFEHVVQGKNIAPGALYAEIGLVVARSRLNVPVSQITLSLRFIKQLRVGNQSVSLHTHFNENDSSLEILRQEDVLCKVNIEKNYKRKINRVNLEDFKQKCSTYVSSIEFYQMLDSFGFQYGRSLSVIGNSWRSSNDYIAEMNISDKTHCNSDSVYLHPTILDGAVQTTALSFPPRDDDGITGQSKNRWIPVRLKSLIVHKEPEKEMFVVGHHVKASQFSFVLNILIVDQNGDVVVEIEGYELQNTAQDVHQVTLADKLYKLDWKQMNIAESVTSENHRSLAVTFVPEGNELFKNVFLSSGMNIAYVPYKYKTNIDIWEDVQKIVNSKCGSFSNVSEILYYPGFHIEKTTDEAQKIFAMIKTSCIVLTYIIQRLLETGVDIPIFIITKQCQSYSNVKRKENSVNVIGSELWGMVRCLVRERIFSQVRLIDFNDDKDIHLLKNIVYTSDVEIIQKAPEYKLQLGNVYINQIVRCPPETPGSRLTLYNSEDILELRSEAYDNIRNPFFIPISGIVKTAHHDKYVKIQVSDAYINDTWTSPIAGDVSDTEPWSMFGDDGYPFYPTELEGKIVTEDTQPSNEPHSKKRDGEKTEVVTCFPTSCNNYVIVPLECTVEKDLMPWYRPCALIEMVIISELVVKSANDVALTVLYDEQLKLDIEILKNIAERLKRNIALIEPIDQFGRLPFNNKVQLLVLTKNFSKVAEIVKQANHDNLKIVSTSGFITKQLERKLRRSFPNCSLYIVNTEELLSKEKLSISIKWLRGWLKTQCKNELSSLAFKKNSIHRRHISGVSFTTGYSNNGLLSANDLPVTTTEDRLFSPQAIYVVIGGLTGLGWEIVEKIAEMGGGVVAIITRRLPNEDQEQNISLLMSTYHCIIDHIQADISEETSLVKAFDYMKSNYPQHEVRGIFQGAAEVQDSIILKMTDEKFDKVLRPKVLGTWNLHMISKDLHLDYFVLHSSITSVFGNSGQTNYGAGNSFLDAMAFYRRSKGLTGQTINWGPLKLGILKIYDYVERHLNAQGYISLSGKEIMDLLVHALLTNDTQVICASFDWKKVIRMSPDMVHLTSRLEAILDEYNLIDLFTTSGNAIKTIDVDELTKCSFEKQKQRVQEIVTFIAAEVCAVETSVLNPNTKLQSIGLDSMKGMAFISTVYEYISCKIPVMSVLKDTTTIDSLTVSILDQINEGGKKGGYIPIEEMYEIRRELDKMKVSFNPVEKMHFEGRTHRDNRNFNFIEATITFDENRYQMDTMKKWIDHILMNNPTLLAVYFIENETPYRASDASAFWSLVENTKEHHPKVNLSQIFDVYDNVALLSTRIGFRLLSKHESDKRELERIPTPKTQLLAFYANKYNDETSQVVIRFDKLYFDSKSVLLLINDLLQMLKTGTHSDISPLLHESNIDEAILEDSKQKRSFWKKRLNQNVKPIIMHPDSSLSASKKRDLIVHRSTLKGRMDITKWANDRSITIRDLFLSVYQIMLNFISENDVISVVTNVDLPSKEKDVSGPSDLIMPIIYQFPEDKTPVGEIIGHISREINSASQNCLSYDVFKTETSPVNHIFANAVFFQNFGTMKLPIDGLLKEQVRFCSVDSHYRTVVCIQDDQEHNDLIVDFQCPPDVADDKQALNVLTGLLELIETIIQNDTLSLEQLRVQFERKYKNTNADMVLSKKQDISETIGGHYPDQYEVLKESSRGFDHSVTIDLVERNGTNGGISWYSSDKKSKRSVATENVSKLQCSTINGMRVLRVETDEKPYVFKSRDFSHMDSIWKKLDSMVRPTVFKP